MPVNPSDQALEAAGAWWVFVVVGLLSLIAGIILILKPSNSLATLAVVVGIFLLIDGIFQLASSFSHANENRALAAIIGVLGIVIGIALIRHPFHGVAAIGILIGIWLVAAGVVRLVFAIAERVNTVMRSVIAVIMIIAGIIVVSDPHIGYATLAVLVGIWFVLNGIGTIALGFGIRSLKPELKAAAGDS